MTDEQKSSTRPRRPSVKRVRPRRQFSLRAMGASMRRHATSVMILAAVGYVAYIGVFLTQRYVNIALVPPAPDLTSAQERQEKLNRALLERIQTSIEQKESFQTPIIDGGHDPFLTALDTTRQNP